MGRRYAGDGEKKLPMLLLLQRLNHLLERSRERERVCARGGAEAEGVKESQADSGLSTEPCGA